MGKRHEAAAQTYVDGLAAIRQMTPREQAEGAWHPGCGRTVEELEDRFRAERGMSALDRSQQSTDTKRSA